MTDTRLTPELVAMAIEAGMLDASLPALRSVIDVRLDILEKRAAASLNPGDQFIVKDCRPKKWEGRRVMFVKHDGMWLECRLVAFSGQPLGDKIRLRASHVGTVYPAAKAD